MSGDRWVVERLARLEERVAELERRLARPPVAGRSRQMQQDWQPDAEALAWAREKYPHVDEQKEREKFRDYWRSRGEVRRDWQAAYRNWIRREAEYMAERGGRRGPANGPASRTAGIGELNRDRRDRVAARLAEIWKDDKA